MHPERFQMFIDKVLNDLTTKGDDPRTICLFSYIDDILIVSNNENENLEEIEALFTRIEEYGLRISALKCQFG